MFRVFAVLIGFSGAGALLAGGWNPLPVRSGYVGGALLVIAAVVARWYWRSRQVSGDDPGAAERHAWLCMAGTALICGFVSVVLMTPGSEVHRSVGDTGGLDSWTMLAGGLIAWALIYDRDAVSDERDRAIDAHAQKVGYAALVILLLVFLFALGFAPKPVMARFTHWLIANTLLQIIMLAALVQCAAQLIGYARNAQQFEHGANP
jgi:4-amino-4-deoxy-L-arabinose transferase-like glycosyltransferase